MLRIICPTKKASIMDLLTINHSKMPSSEPANGPCGRCFSEFIDWRLGYSDYDVFLENDEGSRVYRCKKYSKTLL
jgi:hypothetical protein